MNLADNPSQRGLDFEERVRNFLALALKQDFIKKEMHLELQGKPITCEFDLWSTANEHIIAGEIKNYVWRNRKDFPNGKFEALEYDLVKLALVSANRKLLVLKEDISSAGKSLIEAFIKRAVLHHLLNNIEVWRYEQGFTLEQDSMEQVFGLSSGTIIRIVDSK